MKESPESCNLDELDDSLDFDQRDAHKSNGLTAKQTVSRF